MGFMVQDIHAWYTVQTLGMMAQSSGFRVESSGSGVQVSWLRVYMKGVGFRVSDLWFRVQRSGFRGWRFAFRLRASTARTTTCGTHELTLRCMGKDHGRRRRHGKVRRGKGAEKGGACVGGGIGADRRIVQPPEEERRAIAENLSRARFQGGTHRLALLNPSRRRGDGDTPARERDVSQEAAW